MNNFWSWMEENGYGYKDMYVQILDYSDDFVKAPKQMLIGYMIEYLLGKDRKFLINIYIDFEGIEDFYNYLEDSIKEIHRT